MLVKSGHNKAGTANADPLSDKIRESILALENLRAENLRLTDEIRTLGKILERGYIYRGLKPVNWCFDCGSALA